MVVVSVVPPPALRIIVALDFVVVVVVLGNGNEKGDCDSDSDDLAKCLGRRLCLV